VIVTGLLDEETRVGPCIPIIVALHVRLREYFPMVSPERLTMLELLSRA